MGSNPIRIYNTLTRTKERFEPIHGRRVSMFVCGLTPQDHPHLGHGKTYVAFDVVARYLRHRGYEVFYLQNVTDIDSVSLYAFATDYLKEIIEQIEGLLAKGYAYVSEDGSVYYDTTKFKGWGKLSGQKIEELRPGARVALDERKRHPADFVLWKAQKPGEPAWDSPWGKGRPGWHIEDTAITIRHFGPQYDLHGGATELMFPHHEAELAQAEAYTGVSPFVKIWMHGGMLMVSGEEMHKSLGNYWAIVDALHRWEPEALRFFFLNAHYRSPIDFTPDLIDEATRSYGRLREGLRELEASRRKAPTSGPGDPALRAATRKFIDAFDAAMSDDFQTREAIAAMFNLVRDANKAIAAGLGTSAIDEALGAFRTFGDVLGLFRPTGETEALSEPLLEILVSLRDDARKRKDFATADRIRKALGELGIVIEDGRDGVRWKRKPGS
jgi:cysteinyl-tRNA synthetase